MHQFSKILDKGNFHEALDMMKVSEQPLAFQKFTLEEVDNTITQLAMIKAAGPDCIYNEHLVTSKAVFSSIWTKLFTHAWRRVISPKHGGNPFKDPLQRQREYELCRLL